MLNRNYGIALAVLLVYCAGWLSCHYYEKPSAVQQVAHAQQDLGKGNVEAAKIVEPLKPVAVVLPGSKPIATARFVIAEHEADLRPGVIVQPAPAAASGTPAADPPVTPHLIALCRQLLTCKAETIDATAQKDANGQVDMTVSDQTGKVQATFNAGKLGDAAKVHAWEIGPSYGRGGWGLVVGREFQALPVTVGVDAHRDPQYGLDARVWGVWRF